MQSLVGPHSAAGIQFPEGVFTTATYPNGLSWGSESALNSFTE